MANELFIKATREKFRFASKLGDLTVEQLWDLPLSKPNAADLDSVAKTVNAELRAASEESFVGPAKGETKRRTLEAKLDVVKTIISIKLAERDAAEKRLARQTQKRQLEEALIQLEQRELTNASKEELKARLKALQVDEDA